MSTEPGQRVWLTGDTPHTRLDKPCRHLRTSIHWSKRVYRVQSLPDYTLELSNHWDELPFLLRYFSEYYPHVLFHLGDPGMPVRVFQNGAEITAAG